MGDRCRPKYLGARKLTVRLGERRQVKFYWQESYAEYFSTCLSKGFFYIQNMELLDWVDLVTNKGMAVIFPSVKNLYSSNSYISINYRLETKVLKFSIFQIYN